MCATRQVSYLATSTRPYLLASISNSSLFCFVLYHGLAPVEGKKDIALFL